MTVSARAGTTAKAPTTKRAAAKTTAKRAPAKQAAPTKAPARKAPARKAPSTAQPGSRPATSAPAQKLPAQHISAGGAPEPPAAATPPGQEPPVDASVAASVDPASGPVPAPRAVSASDVPVRPPGTRTRSGNAMARTRAALLEAAAQCVERYGVRRTTMIDIASRSQVAKATLYNHFRTKGDVLAALVHARVEQLAGECVSLAGGPDGLAAALRHAATTIAGLRPLARVAVEEPAVVLRLATPDDGRTWQAARAAVHAALTAAGVRADEPTVLVVVRWLSAQLLWPAGPDEAARGAEILARGLHGLSGGSGQEQDRPPGSPA